MKHTERPFASLLRYATWAPSVRNTQPWRFALVPEGIEVYADYTHRLPETDPESRDLLMSVGAAIMNLRVAAARFGFGCRVDFDFSGVSDRPLAVVALQPGGGDGALLRLFPAVLLRRTSRQPFHTARPPQEVIRRIESGSTGFASSLTLVDDPKTIEAVAKVVEAAAPARDAGWRNAPLLAVIAGLDDVPSWLDAGELLESVLLASAIEGIQASFCSEVTHLPELRAQLRKTLHVQRMPQLLLHLGYASAETPAQPRRPVEECITRSLV